MTEPIDDPTCRACGKPWSDPVHPKEDLPCSCRLESHWVDCMYVNAHFAVMSDEFDVDMCVCGEEWPHEGVA